MKPGTRVRVVSTDSGYAPNTRDEVLEERPDIVEIVDQLVGQEGIAVDDSERPLIDFSENDEVMALHESTKSDDFRLLHDGSVLFFEGDLPGDTGIWLDVTDIEPIE